MLLILNVSDFVSSVSRMILSLIGEPGMSSKTLELDHLAFFNSLEIGNNPRINCFLNVAYASISRCEIITTVHCKEILLLWQENRLQHGLKISEHRHQHLSGTQISKWNDARH